MRSHSFHLAHRVGAGGPLMDDHDREGFPSVRASERCDPCARSRERLDVESFPPFSNDLIDKFLPGKIAG